MISLYKTLPKLEKALFYYVFPLFVCLERQEITKPGGKNSGGNAVKAPLLYIYYYIIIIIKCQGGVDCEMGLALISPSLSPSISLPLIYRPSISLQLSSCARPAKAGGELRFCFFMDIPPYPPGN